MMLKRSNSGFSRRGSVLLAALLAVAIGVSWPGGAHAKDVTLKLASHHPVNSYLTHWAKVFVDRVNKEVGGVTIEFLGGPEVVPPFESLAYINRGTVDLYQGTPGFFAGTIPVGLASYNISVPSKVLRGTDFFQLMDEIHRVRGVTILGDIGRGSAMGTFLKKPLGKADFSGLKIRTAPHLTPFVQALGGAPVVTAPGEVYTALERGVVDGFLFPQGTGLIESKWYEVVDYVIEPMVPYTTCLFIMGNAKKWDSLPEAKRNQIMSILKELEDESWKWYENDAENALNGLLKSGELKKSVLPPADAEKYLKTARESLWAFVQSKDPKYGPKFKAIDDKVGPK